MSRARESEIEEDTHHPRRTYALIGQDAALSRVAHAIRQGRPPQAWLISGAPGIGKATLAYRIARYLLRYGATPDGPEDLTVAKSDSVSRQIEAGAHPGLMVLTRTKDDKGRLSTVLKVEEVRRLGSFFGLTSGAGGWRVAIVDTADDMNDNAANALLKVLEEPPPRAILLLLANAPGRLLPTIRSRCQRLDLRPLSDTAMGTALVELLPSIKVAERDALAALSDGSPGLALRLSEGQGLALAREAQGLIDAKGTPDIPALLVLGDRVARAADGLGDFGEFLARALTRRIHSRAETAEAGLDTWVALWERIGGDFERAKGLHLEPRQTVLSAALAISAARRTTKAG